ncbi:MAG: hypothetical protein AAF481_00815 [Acidobacteriota bacterium]
MPDIHITSAVLRAVSKGRFGEDELIQIAVAHLLELCPTCRSEVAAFRDEPESTGCSNSEFDQVFTNLAANASDLDTALEAERERADADFRALIKLKPEQRIARMQRATRRFRSPFLAEQLIAECRHALPGASDLAFEYSQLALQVALSLPSPLHEEYRALAMAHKGNALRVSGDLLAAREVIDQARNVVRAEGVVDSLVLAEVDLMEGGLNRDQRRFSQSEALLIRSIKLFEVGGDIVRAAAVLLSLGELYRDAGRLDQAIEVLDRAEKCQELRARPRLALCALHNRLFYLAEAGKFAEARQGLCDGYQRYQEFPDHWTQLRLSWLEAKIDAGLGYLDQAVESFQATRDGFLRDGKGYDAALVSLELATVLLEIGRTQEVRRVAHEIAAVFEAQDVHREAMAALVLFQQAAEAEEVTKQFLGQFTRYLEQARRDPSLRFRKPS